MNRQILRLLPCLLPFLVGATEIPEKDWEYERLDDDHVMIHSSDQSRRSAAIDPDTAGDISVPSSLRSMQVVSIGEKAFYNCSKLTSVTIPEGVTNIAENAFYGCSSLTNVVFPTSLKSIGTDAFFRCVELERLDLEVASLAIADHAFIGCEALDSFVFRGDLITLGEAAFSGCTKLRDLSVAAKAIEVGKGAFAYYYYSDHSPYYFYACSSLTNAAMVGTSSVSVGQNAFKSCTSLKDAVVVGPVSATIGESAFQYCSALQDVELPLALVSVSKCAFSDCTSLKSVSFSTNVTEIAYQAFDTCTSLTNVDFSEGLATIDAQAFYGCGSIRNLSFPQSLASVGSRAFEWCDGLIDVRFAEGNTNIASAASVTIGERAFYNCCSLTNATLSQTVSSLGTRAFSQCDALASVNLPTNFTEIAESAFEDCASLPTIDFPDTLVSIGNTAFYGCSSLTGFLVPTQKVVSIGAKAFKNTKYWDDYPDDLVVNNSYILGFKNNPSYVTLPDGCKAIPVSMFEGMTTLKSVTIPDSVTEIGARAFNGCSTLTNLAFRNVTTIGNSAFEGCSSLWGVTLSDCLMAIPGNCFKDCTSLLSVCIPEAVASIGEYAFYNCASLTNVTGGAGVTQVGDYAFAECPSLQPFEFPNDVAYGDHVFQGCTWTEHVLFPTVGTLKDEYPASYMNITSVVFSSSMTTITNGACAGCSSLAYVRIPDGVSSVGSFAFDGCTSLTSVTMAASVASVSTNSFRGCAALKALVVSGQFALSDAFPDTYGDLTEIGIAADATALCDGLFSNCTSLASVEIPWRVESIGARAFYGCSALANLVIPECVTEISDAAFADCKSLKSVDYLCEMPAGVATNIYAGTRGDLMSKVLVQLTNWQTATNSAGTAILPSEWCGRPIVWWATVQSKLAKIRFSDNTNHGGGIDRYYLANAGREIDELPDLPEHPFNTNLVCTGWYTAPSGGELVEDGLPVGGSATYYAHWVKDGEDEPEPEEDDEDEGDDSPAICFALPDELTTGDEIGDAAVDVLYGGSSPTVRMTGLPTGLKFTAKDIYERGSKTEIAHVANTIYGTPTKSGVYTVVATVTTAGRQTASCSQTVIVRKAGESVVKAEFALIDASGVIASTETTPGKVTGIGVYATGKKVALRATANKGYVFAGWYDEFSSLVSSLATYSFTMGEDDVTLTAAFVRSADDKASIGATVNGMSFARSDGEMQILQSIETNACVGTYVEWPVAASALSATTVKVSGLPTGLKFAAMPVVTKTTTGTGKGRKTVVVTNVPANTIYGTPTTASKTDKKGVVQPSKVVVSVTTAGKNSQQFTINFTVLPLPAACVGTFAGYALVEVNANGAPAAEDGSGWIALPCPFTATVDAKGGLSGTLAALGKKLAFKATGYTALDAENSRIIHDVEIPLKTIDKTWTENLGFSLSFASGTATLVSPSSASPHLAVTAIDARRNAAKDTGYAALAKPYAGTYVATFDVPMPDGVATGLVTMALTVDAKGGVKAAGTFVDATTFSASAALDIAADGASAEVLLPVTGRAFGSGGAIFAFGFAKDEAGTVAVASLVDGFGAPVSCAAKYVLATKKAAASYAAYDLLENAAYAYKANAWVGAALTKDDLLSASYLDGETPVEALYAFTASKTGVVTGVGKTANKSKLTFRLNAKTGFFTGANGKTKVFGALYPADGSDATVSGCGSAVFATGSVSPMAIGVVDF